MKLLFVLSIILIIGSALVQSAAACVCTADYAPVCGANGKTYSNKCHLSCAKVGFRHNGAC